MAGGIFASKINCDIAIEGEKMNKLLMQIPFGVLTSAMFLATSLWYRYKGKQFDAMYYLFLTYMMVSLI